jgi:TolB protein
MIFRLSCVLTAIVALTSSALILDPASQDVASRERHLRNIRQLTFGGENAEAYFSPDGTRLIFQSTRGGAACDRIYTMRIDGSDLHRVSTGTGRTTCGYFYPGGHDILFASTHKAGAQCPPKPTFEHGYVWPIYDSYDIYRAPTRTGPICDR